jgi:serine/threonine protein kinase
MLLKSIARILIKYVGNAAGFGVAGDAIIDIWDLWSKYQQDQRQKLEEVQQIAVQSATEARQHAAEAAQEVAADQPETVRQALTAYLSQIPNAIRQSQRRPQDPSGRSVSSQFRLQRPEDLLVLLPPRAPRFKVGDRPAGVGDWELEELLGMGGFGEVWKAKNPYMAHSVALKFCLDPAAAKVLKHEARVLGQVMAQGRHPGIVQLRNTHLNADVPCLEYEFVSGGDLTSLVYRQLQRNQGKLPVEMVTKIMRNVVRGVRHAHKLTPPIVHRDLKPANILVQPRPDGKVELRVADFGIGGVAATCAIDQTRAGASPGAFLTTGGRGSCTPLYCSPQQARGEPPDPRDDVHALGVIWYQLLVGDLTSPAAADWREELAERQVPEPILRLLGSCLSGKAERRPADAGVLADELDKVGPGGGGGEKSAAKAILEALSETVQTPKAIFKKAGTTYDYKILRGLVADGKAVKDGKGYRLRRPSDPPWPPPGGGRTGWKILGHSATRLIRWMGKDGWNAEQARKVIDRYGAADYGDGPLRQTLKEGKDGNMKWGPPADVTEAQAEELRGVRDGTREPSSLAVVTPSGRRSGVFLVDWGPKEGGEAWNVMQVLKQGPVAPEEVKKRLGGKLKYTVEQNVKYWREKGAPIEETGTGYVLKETVGPTGGNEAKENQRKGIAVLTKNKHRWMTMTEIVKEGGLTGTIYTFLLALSRKGQVERMKPEGGKMSYRLAEGTVPGPIRPDELEKGRNRPENFMRTWGPRDGHHADSELVMRELLKGPIQLEELERRLAGRLTKRKNVSRHIKYWKARGAPIEKTEAGYVLKLESPRPNPPASLA